MVLVVCGTFRFVRLRTLDTCSIVFITLLPFYGFMQPVRSAATLWHNVITWLHVTCPGPGNTRFIQLARHEPWIPHDNLSCILVYNADIHVCNRIYRNTLLRDHTWMYAFTMDQGACGSLLCQYSEPIPHLSIVTTHRHTDYQSCKTNNHLHSVDTHFAMGVSTICHCFILPNISLTVF